MLTEEAAKAALAERREQAATRAATRGRATSFLGKATGALPTSTRDAAAATKRLEALGRRGRRAAFSAACPGLGAELAAVFEGAGNLTYQGFWDRRPFRAPRAPSLSRRRVLEAASATVPELVAHGVEPIWLARWGGHLLPQSWQTSAHLVGWTLAAAVDAGNDEVFDLLIASTDGSDEVATMGRHVPVALLNAQRPDGWERIEQMLLSAQREEGLRQSILEVIDEAHPEAFRRLLALIREHELSRFSSVARATAVWFGFEVFAGDRRRVDVLVDLALTHLEDTDHGANGGACGDGLETYVRLWALATRDVHAAIDDAATFLDSEEAERRFSAVAFLAQTRVDASAPSLLRALADDDRRVASLAVRPLLSFPAGTVTESYDLLEALLKKVPKRRKELDPVEWFGPLPALKREEVARLLATHRDPPDLDRILPHRGALDSWDRRRLTARLSEAQLTPPRRGALLELLGDPSPDVREQAIRAAGEVKLTDDEALALEPLLRRKPGDLRRGVIELILGRGEDWALGAAERLLESKGARERLGAVELLRRLVATNSSVVSEAEALLAGHGATEQDVVVEQAARRAVAQPGLLELTEADGFGLVDAGSLTPIAQPRATGFNAATPASLSVLRRLNDLIENHADVEVVIERNWGGSERLLLGAVESAGLARHHERLRAGETDVELPLLDVWRRFATELPLDARDDDGLQLVRAALLGGEVVARYGWHEQSKAAADLGLQHLGLIREIIELLLELEASDHLLAGALDALEDRLTQISKSELRDRTGRYESLPALNIARALIHRAGPANHGDLLRRHWQLERWFAEPPGVKPKEQPLYGWNESQRPRLSDRMPVRPPSEVVVRVFERGAATEADLIDHLVGPRGPRWEFSDLRAVTSPARAQWMGATAVTGATVSRIRERLTSMELSRGEAPTAAAAVVRALSHSGGLDILVASVSALGREKLVRGWSTDGEGRASVFSHMIATSRPAEADSHESFAAAVRTARIGDRRLREIACYAPQWAVHIETALETPGLADAVWWLHAHTKDDRWDVVAELKQEWERTVGDRTNLSAAQLVDGAVDVRWFAEVRYQVAEKELDDLIAAAKYGSTAGGHKRAELFALAMRGELDEDSLLKRLNDKRHQDSVRALGLLPLPQMDSARQEVLVRRYGALQNFRRESRRFGKQRQGSEGRAVDIGLENLARTAGFTDPAQLTWAMEAASTADLAGEGSSAEVEGVSVCLRVDPDGRPELTVRRGDKQLKAVPAKLRRDPRVKALTTRVADVRRQSSRIGTSLEEAMIRGDEIRGEDLARYREHLLLWPRLSRLILIGDETCGFPDRDGRVLRDHAGRKYAIGNTEPLRIAHPLDLLARGDWPAWQRDVLERQVVQPCKQVFREVYVPVEAEESGPGASRRYAGHQVQPGRARALLLRRGWRMDEDGGRRIDHRVHIAASLWFLNGFGSPADIEPPTLEEVRFTSTRTGAPISLDEIPPRFFSETMRDLDLVVSVANIAGVDPEASQSSLEMRGALIAETSALLSYENVRIEGSRAIVEGSISRYSVHLGSGTVHRLPGGAVCIVPVHAQHRGRVFLPFADDDPKSAEVLAKVLMLARDEEIRDPTILEQLRH